MQFLWYLPSLFVGIFTGLTSGYWQVAIISALTFAVMSLIFWSRSKFGQMDQKDKVWATSGGVAIGRHVLPSRTLFWKVQWHEILLAEFRARTNAEHLGKTLEAKSKANFAASSPNPVGLSFWLGVTSDSSLDIDLAETGPHLLIVGPTGSGKSELLRLVASSLLAGYAKQIELVLFDFKGGASLSTFEDEPECLGLATDLGEHEAALLWQKLGEILKKREQQYAVAGVADILQHNSCGGEDKRVIVIIDEFSAVLSSGTQAAQVIENISARGRSLGVHLIVATQSMMGIPRSLLTNLRLRVAMDSTDPIDLVQLGINPQKQIPEVRPGWANAHLSRSNQASQRFSFLLGVNPKPRHPVAELTSSNAPLLPARSQQLLNMYLGQEPEQGQLEELSPSHGSQSPLHREVLHWLGRR